MIAVMLFSWPGFIMIFSILITLSLLIFKRLSDRRIKNKTLNGDNFIITLNSIILIISMLGLAISIFSRVILSGL